MFFGAFCTTHGYQMQLAKRGQTLIRHHVTDVKSQTLVQAFNGSILLRSMVVAEPVHTLSGSGLTSKVMQFTDC